MAADLAALTPQRLREELRAGKRAVLARAISVVENETAQADMVFAAIAGELGGAHVVGVTGAPGVGKSSLLAGMVKELRARDQTVGILAVDPSSAQSGGAILGDRIRMSNHGADRGVFFRSLASRGHVGGLSRTAARVIDVLDASGKDVIIVETVGAGQSDVEIARLTHSNVVVCAGGLGDAVQAVKAGILEIADVLVVNKSDLPGAARTTAELKEAQGFSSGTTRSAPVLQTVATEGKGVVELVDALQEHRAALSPEARRAAVVARVRCWVELAALDAARRRVRQHDGLNQLADKVLRAEIPVAEVAAEALRLLADHP